MDIFEKVRGIIAEQLEIEEVESIKPEASIMNDLEADSLDAVEVMMGIEDEFDIEIPEEDAEKFKNIKDIVEYVESKIA
ncbi:acyl carrier protein [Sporanaerobacter acetigenes]|uniref:Acyl carrier protein n=1 Tax=Sporanaerobacter acetigenes DSM 13106 TaxID=1123281 RepID=A0A1M5XAL9_9FIRM|nr:acyl carrier protein [Sporanaerobacter acetigenes]SHH96554.1 acyl carrier protein [Sporanaerobacter acetigenes DSM 13106]